ncbi:LacI family DNA-binding transcriptional regulator [Nonomuraea roseoviolacea]|uniref:DNA-binding LacI/PurR family transcriptional regulator n=1 Tax=Nonomuraea roseoviolacea subsp. carminata TaxID=160689 RepID=A0ABT1KJ09_9ACTN|nr:LacI family DNA-binding transcriptional regulator [Nonomuraea roseoviolacea]MCP2352939.1 DNA-binding LacI/PurR family transcriptional regulator [Nonomuraea roseoviolacea subsp. carminata]
MAKDPSRPRPTMAEVARAAKVSVMTVSYTYAQPDRVSERTRARVREAAARLGYPGPHPGARSLRRGRAGSLGVVLGEHLTYAFEDPQATRFLAGVAEVCAGHGLGLTILPITGAPSDADRVAEAAVDGFVVWTTSDDDPVLSAVAATGLPAVVHGGPHRPNVPFVAIDDRAAARAVAAEALAGARRPMVLSFPLDRARTPGVRNGPDPAEATFRVTRERLRGVRDAWEAAGGRWPQVRVAVCARNSAGEADSLATAFLAGPDAPDAVMAMSDELALGLMRAAARAGLAVPGDLAVTGWDDTDAAAAAGLTTVAQDLRAQGACCARLVLGEETADGTGPVEWRLVVRDSTRR